MSLLDYFAPKTYPAPPVVEHGKHGHITRFDPMRIPKPIEIKAPEKKAVFNDRRGRPGKEDVVIDAIKRGLCTYQDIQSEVEISRQCLIGHIQNLEAEGLIKVDRNLSPYQFSMICEDDQ